MDAINVQVQWMRLIVNEFFRGQEPWRIVAVTSSSVLSAVWFYNFVFQEENLTNRVKGQVFRLARKVPFIAAKIKEQLDEIESDFQKDAAKRLVGLQCNKVLPAKGLTDQAILELLDDHIDTRVFDWRTGRVSGAVYRNDPELVGLVTTVYGKASYTNPLHPDVFPGVCKIEAEVVRMTCNLFNGGPESCGTMTTGGSESIIMAMKACRDFARFERGIDRPEVILPTSAHPAFDKAAGYFRVKLIHIPVDENAKVDIKTMRSAISKRTCMLVGSAPNFPYGTMDDIEAISELGVKYNIPVHVDACLGGFVIAFMEKAGYQVPPFDFRLPGVTSISADTHKYGYTPKGSSVVMYRCKELLHHQYTITTDWSGGIYGSPTVNGSRAGGVIAASWATMLHFGLDGYVQATKEVVETTRYIETELRKMPEIFIFGTPVSSVIAVGSNVFAIYRLSDALGKLGWDLSPLQYPAGFHLCVTHVHTQPGVKESFVNDIKTELATIMLEPNLPVEGKMAMYGMSSKIPDRSIVTDLTRFFIDSMYFIPNSVEGAGEEAKKECGVKAIQSNGEGDNHVKQ